MSSRVKKMRAITPLELQIERLEGQIKGLRRSLDSAHEALSVHESLALVEPSMRGYYQRMRPWVVEATMRLSSYTTDQEAKGIHIIIQESMRRAVDQCKALLNADREGRGYINAAEVTLRRGEKEPY